MKSWLVKVLLCCFGCLAVLSCAASCKQQSHINIIASLVAERAGYMKEVALIKYAKNQNPYDALQELRVLEASNTAANKYRLPVNALYNFSQIQMDFSKQIQAYWLARWKKEKKHAPGSVPSLNVVRNKIKKVTTELYKNISEENSGLEHCSVEALSKILKHHFRKKQLVESSFMPIYETMLAYNLKALVL